MALIAGARRTARSYTHFSEAKNAADVIVAGSQAGGLSSLQFAGGVELGLVEQLPDIQTSTRAFGPLLFTGHTDGGINLGPSDMFPVAPSTTALGTEIEQWKMLSGRAADPQRVDEVVASFDLAQRLKLRVGSTIDLHFFTAKSFPAVAGKLLTQFADRLQHQGGRFPFEELADGPHIVFKVVGIEASPAEFPPRLLDISPVLHLTPTFYERYQNVVLG